MSDDGAAPPAARPPWVARALLAVAVVFLLENAKPLMLPMVVAVAFTFVLAAPVAGAPQRHARLRRRRSGDRPGARGPRAAGLAARRAGRRLVGARTGDRAPAARIGAAPAHRRVSGCTDRRRAPPAPAAAPASAPAGAADPLTEHLTTEGISITRAALGQALSFIVAASATIFLLYFLLASEHWLIARTVEAIPRRRTRALLLSGIRQAQIEIGLFITTMGLISIGLGVATGIGLAVIGFPNPVLWATTTAVLTFVPYIGPVLVTLALLVAGGMNRARVSRCSRRRRCSSRFTSSKATSSAR